MPANPTLLQIEELVEASLTLAMVDPETGEVIGNGAANEHADVLLWKSLPKTQIGVTTMTELHTALTELDAARATIAELTATVKTLKAESDERHADLRARERDLADVRRQLETEVAKNEDPEEAVLKTMSDPARVAYLAMKEQNARLTKRLDEADERAKLTEIQKGLERDMPGLPVGAADLAPVMKAVLPHLTEEQADTLRRALIAGSEAIRDLQKAMALSGHGLEVSDAEQELDRLTEARQKAYPTETHAAAYTAVLRAHPDLYTKSRAARATQ